jgi:hypothetical protein
MGYEQIDFNFDSPKSKIIPHSETLPKNGESEEDYALRSFSLTKKILSGEVIVAEPNIEEINKEIELDRQSDKNKAIKSIEHKKIIYNSEEAKIRQMKSRKDLDY